MSQIIPKKRVKKHCEIFLEVFEIWRRIFNAPQVEIRKDLRINCTALVEDDDQKHIILRYHPKKLQYQPIYVVISDALHELGHVLHKAPYDTKQEQIDEEFYAERFAVVIMKAYYKKEYRKLINYVTKRASKWETNWGMDEIHRLAFKQIKEYRSKRKSKKEELNNNKEK